MNIMKKPTAPRYQRDQITSYLLVSAVTGGSEKLTITLVEMEKGGFQHIHAHEQEQCYYIMEGRGMMMVDAEMQEVEAGDCIFFPSHARHGLNNIGDGVLRYLSAASPSFSSQECRDLWPLSSEEDLK